MAETPDAGNAGPQTPQQTPQQMPQVKILAHFVRDLSFENVGVIQGTPAQGQPDIAVQVNLDGGSIGQGNYQLNMKISARATIEDKTRFLAELDYGGIFGIENAAEQHIHPLLFIEGPRLLWPFARRVIADVTRDGGYPSLMLESIDFATLYRQRLEQMRRENKAAGQPAGGPAGAAGAAGTAGAAGAAGAKSAGRNATSTGPDSAPREGAGDGRAAAGSGEAAERSGEASGEQKPN